MKNLYKCIFILLGSFFLGCADLDVENLNDPDFDRVVNTPDDLKGAVAGAFTQIQRAFYGYEGHPNFEWTADHITMTNNVSHWWSVYKVEPRVQLNNSLTYTELANLDLPWSTFNAAISNANDVINAIEVNGLSLGDDTQMVLAGAYLARGIAAGYLANTFDQGYVVEVGAELSTLELQPYTEVVEYAVSSLDRCIEISNANDYVFGSNFINTPDPYNNDQISRLASTYAGYFLMTNARTAAENASTDWNRVLNYANNGMTEDYILMADNNAWQNWLQQLSGLYWYWRVDHRIIRLFDPSYPKRFPLEPSATVPPATSDDNRLELYYVYETDLSFFNLSRGPQLRSHYRWDRYPEQYANNGIGPIRQMFAYQNDLMKAEALIMANGDVAGAVEILNSGPRITVGGLSLLETTISEQEALDIIFAERDIELTYTDYNLHHKDMRRKDALQIGSLTMHPVPASELSVIGEDTYTFGGISAAGQPGTASGTNSWLDN